MRELLNLPLFGHFHETSELLHFLEPLTNIKKGNDSYTVEIFLPGFKKENINLEIKDSKLVVSAECRQEKEDSFLHREFSVKPTKKVLTLSRDIDIQKINAKYLDGILYIDIPKKKQEIVSNKISVL